MFECKVKKYLIIRQAALTKKSFNVNIYHVMQPTISHRFRQINTYQHRLVQLSAHISLLPKKRPTFPGFSHKVIMTSTLSAFGYKAQCFRSNSNSNVC